MGTSAADDDFGLDATAIVGCGISLFFCVVAVLAFIFFRPRTEPFMIKQHLTLAVGLTQIILLLSVAAYRKKEGCQAMSVILHYTVTSCFTWCLLDSLYIYFNHTNSAHPLRKKIYYLLFGWGFPMIVLGMSLTIGLTLEQSQGKRVLSLYSCWPSDHIVWTFVIPSLLIATLNLMISCATLHNLRQPSYDICARAVLEKRSIRYCLRTNSILLLSLCLGWVFGILSFRGGMNIVRFQLTFGLINGLQGIFLFFFHCVLNIDIKGYYQPGVHRCSHEDGCLTDRERSKRVNTQTQDPLLGSRRKISSRSHTTENNPLISVGAQKSTQAENSSRSQSSQLRGEQRPVEVSRASNNAEPHPTDQKATEKRTSTKPDHDAYPSLPGTPEPHISEYEIPAKQPKRKSSPPELISKNAKKEMDGMSKSATMTSLHSHAMPAGDTESIPSWSSKPAEHLRVHQRVEKSSSESAIPVFVDQRKAERNYRSSHVVNNSASRKPSIQSTASTGSSERKPRRSSRATPGTSLNELESLFSNPVYMKPQRPSVSSLYSAGGRERKVSAETVHASDSRKSSQNTEETML